MTPAEIEARLAVVCGEILSLNFWIRRNPDDVAKRDRKRALEHERDWLLNKRPKVRRKR